MTPLAWAGAALAALMTLAQLGALRFALKAGGQGSAFAMVGAWHVLLAAALAEAAWYPDAWHLPGGFALGLGLLATGFAVRVAAVRRLDRHFSPLVELQDGHMLVTKGAYARVRHPAYLGTLMWVVALPLLLDAGCALLLVPLVYGPALRARIRDEERLLAGAFGAEWAAYAMRTPALLPRIGRSVNPM